MTEISNKKKKFIKRNSNQLSIEELARQTWVNSRLIGLLIDDYDVEIREKTGILL